MSSEVTVSTYSQNYKLEAFHVEQLTASDARQSKVTVDLLRFEATSTQDKLNINLKDVYKSLTLFGDRVVAKLDELLKDKLPGGVRSLKPEEHTAEKTADRIFDGVTKLLPIYAKQHPELSGEELVDKFLETVRGGIRTGYNQAASALSDIGAFDFEGVKAGIEKTMQLVEEKLEEFRKSYLESLKPKEQPETVVEPENA